jgi:putative nucleotidyltransferase with HDIG domain
MGAALDGLLHRRCKSPHFKQQPFSLHAIASAAVAQHLAKTTRVVEPELAFSLGLLHDIGKLGMDQCFPDHYTEVYLKAKAEELDLIAAEQALGQPTHARIGATLARNWGLADPLVVGILHHHDHPPDAPNPDLVAIMRITHYICGVKNAAPPDCFAENHLDAPAWQQLKLQADALPGLLSTVDAHIAAVRQMFEL